MQEQEKLAKGSPLKSSDEATARSTKEKASPEVVVIEKAIDVIEISPDPIPLTESLIPSNENTVCVFEGKKEKLEISSKELSVSGNSFPFIILLFFKSVAIFVLSSCGISFRILYSSEFFSRIAH